MSGSKRAKPYVPPKKDIPGSYRVDITTRSQSGQIRDSHIYVDDAKSSRDAMNQATKGISNAMTIIKIAAVFLGLGLLYVVVTGGHP